VYRVFKFEYGLHILRIQSVAEMKRLCIWAWPGKLTKSDGPGRKINRAGSAELIEGFIRSSTFQNAQVI